MIDIYKVKLNQRLQHTSDVSSTKQRRTYVRDFGSTSYVYVKYVDLTFSPHQVQVFNRSEAVTRTAEIF